MTFDEDLTRRVQDTISAFLSSAQPIIKQLQAQIDVDQSITNLPTDTSPSAHSLVGTTPKLSYTRQLLYSQLMSNPHATSIAMFIAPDVAMVYTREGLYVEMNAATAPIGAIVFYTIDARGNPQSYFQETSIPPEFAKQLAATQTSLLPNELSWSQIFNVTPANLGFICTAVLTKPQTTTSSSLMPTPTTTPATTMIVGSALVAFSLNGLEEQLHNAFASEKDHRVVFVVDEHDKMVAASQLGVSTQLVGGGIEQVNVTACSLSMVRIAGEVLASENTSALCSGNQSLSYGTAAMYLHKGLQIYVSCVLIRSSPFSISTSRVSSNLLWRVVIVREAGSGVISRGYWNRHSSGYAVLITLVALKTVMSCLLLYWVLLFRKLRLWRVAHVRSLVLILVTGLCSMATCVVLIDEPATSGSVTCVVRLWTVHLMVELFPLAICGRILLLLLERAKPEPIKTCDVSSSNDYGTQRLKSLHFEVTSNRIAVFVTVLLVQLVGLLLLQSLVAPGHSTEGYEVVQQPGNGKAIVLQRPCLGQSSLWLLHRAAIGAMLWVLSVVVLWKTRGIVELQPAIRPALVWIIVLMMFVCLVSFVAFTWLPSNTALGGIVVVAIVIGVFGVEFWLIIPRIYRQVKVGDVKVTELREFLVKRVELEKAASGGKSNTSLLRAATTPYVPKKSSSSTAVVRMVSSSSKPQMVRENVEPRLLFGDATQNSES